MRMPCRADVKQVYRLHENYWFILSLTTIRYIQDLARQLQNIYNVQYTRYTFRRRNQAKIPYRYSIKYWTSADIFTADIFLHKIWMEADAELYKLIILFASWLFVPKCFHRVIWTVIYEALFHSITHPYLQKTFHLKTQYSTLNTCEFLAQVWNGIHDVEAKDASHIRAPLLPFRRPWSLKTLEILHQGCA